MSSQLEKLIISATSLDVDKDVKYSKPKINKSGGKSINIQNSQANSVLNISTPLMLTWGVNEYVDDASGKKTYNMSLQFPQEDYKTDETSAFLDTMIRLQDKIKKDAVDNCKDWFGKNTMSAEVIDALFTPMLRYTKDKETGEPDMTRSPSLRVKLPYWEGKFNLEIYNVDRELVFPTMESDLTPTDLIQKGQNVALVIQSGGIWFANGKFGTTWKLVQAVVQPKASILGNNTCHVTLSQSDREVLATEKNDDNDETSVTAVVESSDDESAAAAAQVAAAVQEPATQKKKKVVRKRKTAAATADN